MILIKKAYLLSMAEVNYEYRDILIDKGKIVKIAKEIKEEDCKNCTVIKALGRYVTPGFVDPHCHIGILETVFHQGDDVNECTDPVTPNLRAYDGVNPKDPYFASALEAGVTTFNIGPGSANVIGGTFTIFKNRGETKEDMCMVEESAMKMALGENPKRVYGNGSKAPQTRMGSAALMRETLDKAKEYHLKYQQYLQDLSEGKEVSFTIDYKLHSLMRVFEGMLVKVHCHRADDIETAVKIMEEYNLNYTLEHCTEGYLIPDFMVKHHVRCNIGPTMSDKSKPEVMNKSFDSGRVLANHNILFGIMTDHPVIEEDNTMLQLQRFVRAGMNELDALKCVTINAAKLTGIDDKVGSIEVGKDADIVIWSHNPYHYLATPKTVFVDGNIVLKK